MNVNEAKNEEVGRIELLYHEPRLMDLQEKYGNDAGEIKSHIDTPAFIYEIRTALRYWNGKSATHRTSDALWYRLDSVENHGVPLTEVRAL